MGSGRDLSWPYRLATLPAGPYGSVAPSDPIPTVRRPWSFISCSPSSRLQCSPLGGFLVGRSLRGQLGGSMAQLGGTLDITLGEIESRLDRRLGELDARVDRRFEGLDGRLLTTQKSAGETATQIAEKLARVEQGTKSMLERANDLKRLEQALRPPKARGGFGELLLANLLADILPANAYELQYGFAGGERVDAVVRVEKLLPVDAKFPLDNVHRVLDAEDDGQRRACPAGAEPRRQDSRRRDRDQVHPPRRGDLRLRVHVSARRVGLLRDRVRRNRGSSSSTPSASESFRSRRRRSMRT